MRIYRPIIFSLGVALIVIRVFFNPLYTVDASTIILFLIICVPIGAEYLSKAKILGQEFQFKDTINETKVYVEKSKLTAKRKGYAVISATANLAVNGRKAGSLLEVFNLELTKDIFKKDVPLALASLRIEIESKIREAYNLAYPNSSKRPSLSSMMNRLKDKGWLEQEQIEALNRIMKMCNKAVHGLKVERSVAEEIIGLAEELNKTFSMGYYINIAENHNYKKHNLFCEWEHCIELMPLPHDTSNKACPVFGHECPGGSEKVLKCDKRIDRLHEDIPKE